VYIAKLEVVNCPTAFNTPLTVTLNGEPAAKVDDIRMLMLLADTILQSCPTKTQLAATVCIES
jgi:hypothetical protein